jgi:pimeloyl-ACP methyl ester carboxylesterase
MIERFDEIHPKRTWTNEALDTFQTEHYDNEWSKSDSIEIEGEHFLVHRMNPDRPELETPVLLVGGWNATDEILKENGRAVAAEGATALIVNAAHGSEHTIEVPEHIEKVFDVELRRIFAFIETLDQEKIEKVYAIGHSEGALDILLAAAIFPERFKGIALVNPGGMIADDDPIRLSLRFARDAIRSWYFASKQNTIGKKMDIDARSTKSAWSEKIQSIKEVVSVGYSHAYELLRDVREHDIDILLMHGPEDVVFPFNKMRATIQDMKTSPEEDIRNLFTGVYSVSGDHNSFLREPAKRTRPLMQDFKTLDKRRTQRESAT